MPGRSPKGFCPDLGQRGKKDTGWGWFTGPEPGRVRPYSGTVLPGIQRNRQDILTIPLRDTEPVLYLLSWSILLPGGIRIQPDLVAGHIPQHVLVLVTVLVAGTVLEHRSITV